MKVMPGALFATVVFSTLVAVATATPPDKILDEIAAYRQWIRITTTPLIIQNFAAAG